MTDLHDTGLHDDPGLLEDLRDAWSDLRVRGFRAKVTVKRAVYGWLKRHRRAYRKARNLRRLVLLAVACWLAFSLASPVPAEVVTAALGLAGMALARMVPRKSSRSKRR
jgi:hypothetical protein